MQLSPPVHLQRRITLEPSRALDTVVLPQAGLVDVQRLTLELGAVGGEEVMQLDLVEVFCAGSGSSGAVHVSLGFVHTGTT